MNPKVRKPVKDNRGKTTRWRAMYSIEVDGKVVRKQIGTFDTMAQAKAETQKYVDGLITAYENELVSTDITVQQFMDDQWKEYRSAQLINDSSMVIFEKLCQSTGFSDIRISKINAKALRRFWLEVEDYIEEKDRSSSFKTKLKADMNSLLNLAVQESYLAENLNYNIKTDTARSQKRVRNQNAREVWERAKKIWTPEQIVKYLPLFKDMDKKPKNVDPIMWWAFINIAIFTGLRRGEITGLKFSDFDRENRVLTVQRSAQLIQKTGNREVRITHPKASSFGEIHYSSDLDAVLDALELYHQLKGTLGNEYLLQYRWGGIIAPGVNLSLKNLISKAELIPKINLNKTNIVIGKNTKQAVVSGFYWGYSGLIEKIILKISKITKKNFKIILTGGLAHLFKTNISFKVLVDKNLTIKGLIKAHKILNK